MLAAAALRCIGGQMQGRLLFRNDDERGRAHRLGITDLNRKYGLLDLAHGRRDVRRDRRHQRHHAAAACGASPAARSTHSVVMRSKSGTVRYIEAQHDFNRKQPELFGR